jgi:hypothetical protein
MELVKGDLKVMWSVVPSSVVPLLRFDVMELVDGEWEAMDNGSSCTEMPVGSPETMLKSGLEVVMDAVECNRSLGVKQVVEDLAWMAPVWFE